MWEIGNQKVKTYENYNAVLKNIEGELDDLQAKVTLTKFLKSNIGFTFEMLSGTRLLHIQEIIIKAILVRDLSLLVAGRGFSKSFIISVLSLLFPIFVPGSAMCLISSNFRSSRRILEMAEKMTERKEAKLLRSCFPNNMRRSNDIYKWKLEHGSEVFALPLSTGDGLRGTRCNFLVIDEGLNISKEIQDTILRPFLTVKQNITEEMKVREIEDKLILNNLITEADRISFPKNKFAVFSSASYEFEYLYEMYRNYIENITNPPKDIKEKDTPTYFVMRASYEALPENSLMDFSQINAAKANGGENADYFKREYRALFTNSSDGYFNVKKLHNCTVKNGNFPTTQVVGDKDSEYILTIDPSYAANKNSDYFAMGVYLINRDERKITLVHTYGKAGGDIKEHFEYFVYLLTYFNVVFISIDASGTEFITGFNESMTAKDKNIKVEFLNKDIDFNTDDAVEYNKSLQLLKKDYNLSNRRIVYAQGFYTSNNAIRRMNEHLQNQIESERVWFASPTASNEVAFKRYSQTKLPYNFKNNKEVFLGIGEFIEDQDSWIKETKSQISLIEVKSTSTGVLQYDLPASLRRLVSNDRPRKDHYSCVLMATWIAKVYFDMIFAPKEEVKREMFTPTFL